MHINISAHSVTALVSQHKSPHGNGSVRCCRGSRAGLRSPHAAVPAPSAVAIKTVCGPEHKPDHEVVNLKRNIKKSMTCLGFKAHPTVAGHTVLLNEQHRNIIFSAPPCWYPPPAVPPGSIFCSSFHRITAWFGFEGTPKLIQFQWKPVYYSVIHTGSVYRTFTISTAGLL